MYPFWYKSDVSTVLFKTQCANGCHTCLWDDSAVDTILFTRSLYQRSSSFAQVLYPSLCLFDLPMFVSLSLRIALPIFASGSLGFFLRWIPWHLHISHYSQATNLWAEAYGLLLLSHFAEFFSLVSKTNFKTSGGFYNTRALQRTSNQGHRMIREKKRTQWKRSPSKL